MTVPGIGPISATAIAALAPPGESFAKGRDSGNGRKDGSKHDCKKQRR